MTFSVYRLPVIAVACSLVLVFVMETECAQPPARSFSKTAVKAHVYPTNANQRIVYRTKSPAVGPTGDQADAVQQTDADTNGIRRIFVRGQEVAAPTLTLQEMVARVAATTNRIAEIDAELERLKVSEHTERAEMGKHQRTILEFMRGEMRSDDEEVIKLRNRLKELEEETRKIRETLRKRMEADPQVKAALEKRETYTGRAKEFSERRRDLLLERRKLALEQSNLEKSIEEVPEVDGKSTDATPASQQ